MRHLCAYAVAFGIGSIPLLTAPPAHAGTFSELTEGVTQVVAGGWPGPVYPENDNWVPIVAGDEDTSYPSLILMARSYGAGRVIADSSLTGNDLTILDNLRFNQNVMAWLAGSEGGSVAYTTGHGEFNGTTDNIGTAAESVGLKISALPAPITAESLEPYSSLIISIAWGEISDTEIDVIEQWVLDGGGLLMKGLGWSWLAYHPEQTMEDFPMMHLGSRFGARWLGGGILDPTDQFDGATIFHTFYPDVESPNTQTCLDRIIATHDTHGQNLPDALQADDELKYRFLQAHAGLAIPTREFPMEHPDRTVVYEGSADLLEQWPEFYARGFSFDRDIHPVSAWSRERAWLTWRDSLGLTPERKEEMAGLGQLLGKRKTLFMNYGMLILDNDGMEDPDLQLILDVRDLTPPALLTMNAMSAIDYLGTNPGTFNFSGAGYGVNVFAVHVGQYTENPFPDDVEAYPGDGFMAVVSHEVNHVVDAIANQDPEWLSRKYRLIENAGEDPMNYLRSTAPEGFFVNAPQEFFASIANQWFALSERAVELGLHRFDIGRLEPINQALFFLDTYSDGTDVSWFYESDATGLVLRTPVLLERDTLGHMICLDHQGSRIEFSVDEDGDVTSYLQVAASGGGCCLQDRCVFVQEASCITAGGFYLGDDVACSDDCASICPGDVTDNGYVDVADLLFVISNWQDPYTVEDLLLVISEWNNTCP